MLIYQVYGIFQDRGHAASSLAIVELGKQMVVLGVDGSTRAVWYLQNVEELQKDIKELWQEVNERAIKPVTTICADLLAPPVVDAEPSPNSSNKSAKGGKTMTPTTTEMSGLRKRANKEA